MLPRFHFSVEYFEDLRNVNHCEFVIMNADPVSGKYSLQNQLRTWSALKRERAAAQDKAQSLVQPESPIPVRKRWGGCPNGCEHGKDKSADSKRRQDWPAMKNKCDGSNDNFECYENELGSPAVPFSEAEDDPRGQVGSLSTLGSFLSSKISSCLKHFYFKKNRPLLSR